MKTTITNRSLITLAFAALLAGLDKLNGGGKGNASVLYLPPGVYSPLFSPKSNPLSVGH